MKLNKTERFVSQVTSGRWILTVLAGAAFFGFCVALCFIAVKERADFKPETIVAMFSALLLVIQGVYKDYFNRERETPKEEPSPNGNNAEGK